MADFDPDTVVLDVVRKQTGNATAAPESRFAEDLGLSENGRRALFAFMVEAFTARGLNLPARGFFLSDFLVCKTPGDVQRAIKDIMSGARKQKPAAAKAPTASPAAPTAPASPVATAPAPQAAASDEVPREKRKPATSRVARSPAKAKGGTAKKTAKKAPARKAPKGR